MTLDADQSKLARPHSGRSGETNRLPAPRNRRTGLPRGRCSSAGLAAFITCNPAAPPMRHHQHVRRPASLLENTLVKVTVNPQTGDIASLVDKRSGHEFVDLNSPYALNSYRYLHGGNSTDKDTAPTDVVI